MADDEKHGAGHQTGDMRGHPPLARQRSHRVCFELCEEPENAELEVCVPYAAAPLTNGRHQWVLTFHLHDFTSVGDLKKAIYKQLRRDARGLQKESFMSGWLRLEGSSIVFQNDHPLFLVAQLLQPESERLIRIRLDLEPGDKPKPVKEGYLFKQGGPFKRYSKRFFRLQDGHLLYGKNEDDKLKEIDLRGFTVLDDPAEPLDFEIENGGRSYLLRAETEQEKTSWISELHLLFAWALEVRQPAAVNVTDNSVLHCKKCKRLFGFITRKNVCKDCQFVYCDDCFNKPEDRCNEDVEKRKQATQQACAAAAMYSGVDASKLAVPNVTDVSGSSTPATNTPRLNGTQSGDSAPTTGSLDDEKGCAPPLESPGKAPTQPLRVANRKAEQEVLEAEAALGTLELIVVQAYNVMAADSNGLSDPFAVVYFEDQMQTTEVKYETLNPVWTQRFAFKARGEGHSVQIAVFDKDKFSSNDFLGMVFIPLHELDSGRLYDKWYPLRKRPGKYGADDKDVRGRIQLQVRYTHSPLALVKPIPEFDLSEIKDDKRREVLRRRRKAPKLDTATISKNIDRLSQLQKSLQLDAVGSWMDDLFAWKSPPVTLLYMLVFLFLCIYLPAKGALLLVPLLLLFFLITNYVRSRFFTPPGSESTLEYVVYSSDSDSDLSDDEDEEERESRRQEEMKEVLPDKGVVVKQKTGVFAGVKRARKQMRDMQNKLGDLCDMLERFSGLMLWRNPVQSMWFARVLVVALVAIALIPTRMLVAAAGMNKFTKHLRKRMKAIKEGRNPDEFVRRNSGNLLVNFLSRAPCPWDNECTERNLVEDLKNA